MRFNFECGCQYIVWAEQERVKAGLACCSLHESTPQTLRNILSRCPMLLTEHICTELPAIPAAAAPPQVPSPEPHTEFLTLKDFPRKFREIARSLAQAKDCDHSLEVHAMADMLQASIESATLTRVPVVAARWTDQDLYDAYLWGCEDECLPEPLDKGTFIAGFEDTVDVK